MDHFNFKNTDDIELETNITSSDSPDNKYIDTDSQIIRGDINEFMKGSSVSSLIHSSLTVHQKLLIDDYLDKTFVMSILCERTKNYYYNMKVSLQLPAIIIACILCFFNAASDNIPDEKHYVLKWVNVTANAFSAFIISIQSLLQVGDKYNQFSNVANKFTKLEHHIETSINNNPDLIDERFITDSIRTYDTIIDDIDFTFPGFIKTQVKMKYKDKRTMPNILNGDKKPRLLQNL